MAVASQQQIYQLNYPAQLSQASTKTHTFPLRIKVLSQPLRRARDLVVPPEVPATLSEYGRNINVLIISERGESSHLNYVERSTAVYKLRRRARSDTSLFGRLWSAATAVSRQVLRHQTCQLLCKRAVGYLHYK